MVAKKVARHKRCSCLKPGLRCADLCKCQDCINVIPDSDSDEENGVCDDFAEYLASEAAMDDV